MGFNCVGTCKSCGASIRWVITTKLKKMPCDPDPIRFTPAGGPETFVTREGKVERGKRDPQGSAVGFISHFATCPAADRHRKKAPVLPQLDDYDEHRYSGLISEE